MQACPLSTGQIRLTDVWLACRSVPVQKHLEKVYATLAAALVVAALGAYVQILTGLSAGLFGVIGAVICMTWLTLTQPTVYNVNRRSALYLAILLCNTPCMASFSSTFI